MSRNRGKSACGMARHIWEPKRKRKLQARRVKPLAAGGRRDPRSLRHIVLCAQQGSAGSIRAVSAATHGLAPTPGVIARPNDRCRHTVICAQQGSRRIDPGGRLKFPIALAAANVFDVFRVRLAASPRRFVALRQAEIAHVERHRVRRAAGSAEPMGPRRVRGDSGGADRDRPELSRHFRALARAEQIAGVAGLLGAALLRVPDGAAHVCGPRRLARLHLHLRHARGQEPAGGNGADPGARHPPVGADSGLSVLHGDFLPRPLPRQYLGRGTRGDFRDLHQSGLEHGLFLLPVAAHRAAAISTRSRADSASPAGRSSGSSKRHSRCRASSGTR